MSNGLEQVPKNPGNAWLNVAEPGCETSETCVFGSKLKVLNVSRAKFFFLSFSFRQVNFVAAPGVNASDVSERFVPRA